MNKIILITALMLAGCMDNPLPQTTTTFKDESMEKSKPYRAKVADFLFPEVNHNAVIEPLPKVYAQPSCYKTWDKPVCYTDPVMGDESRLVGSRY